MSTRNGGVVLPFLVRTGQAVVPFFRHCVTSKSVVSGPDEGESLSAPRGASYEKPANAVPRDLQRLTFPFVREEMATHQRSVIASAGPLPLHWICTSSIHTRSQPGDLSGPRNKFASPPRERLAI